ncbi:MAG: hypothetical protein QM668_15595 [Agriterribacter sp.]
MATVEKQMQLRDKILLGLEKSYKKLLEFKKQKNSELVVMKDNRIVKIKPEQLEAFKKSMKE